MENTILIMLIVIALLVCAIAGLIIKISGQAQKIKTMEATNKTLYKSYVGEIDKREKAEGIAERYEQKVGKLSTVITQQNKVIDRLEQYNRKLKNANKDLAGVVLKRTTKAIVKKPTTADYKKQIIKDYKAGADVHDIATKYCLKSNTVFKAIQRWKAK